ncbi:predicted protein [Postia placenta Mad-698-R]|nr:predicted protein [Postia placenta Mad-698-R]
MSTESSSAQPVVAIVGATGNLGNDVAEAFLNHYRSQFSKVIAVVRDPTSVASRKLAEAGVELRQVDQIDTVPSFARAFAGADVVVSAVSNAPLEYHDALFDAAFQNGVKVYFPSDFGVDYHVADFPGYEEPLWVAKAQHVSRARELSHGKIKIIELNIGMFIEFILIVSQMDHFGFDAETLTFTFAGSPDSRLAVTAKADIARSLAQLALLALVSSSVPDVVRIAGQNVSYRKIGQAAERVREERELKPKNVTLKAIDLEAYKAATREEQVRTGVSDLHKHIKIVVGEGKVDFSHSNHNELVNPGEKWWKWKRVEDYARELGGRL